MLIEPEASFQDQDVLRDRILHPVEAAELASPQFRCPGLKCFLHYFLGDQVGRQDREQSIFIF